MKHTLYLLFYCCFFFFELPLGTAQLNVQGLLHLQDDALLYVEPDVVIETQDGIVENNGTIVAEGNITKEVAASYLATSTTGSRKVILQGNNPIQRITGDFTGVQSFYELSLKKGAGIAELNSNIEVSQFFNLIQGKLRTDINSGTQASDYQYELYLSNPASNALSGNFTVLSSTNFVEGRLRRSVAGLGNYNFPVGITENNPVFISFKEAAPLSDITASFEQGTSTLIGTTFSCPTTASTNIDCTLGNWNLQSTATNYNYDIRFSPSMPLLQNCPGATAFFVSKNGSFDCNLDTNINDGITSAQTGGFGVFDLPAALPIDNVACPVPNRPVVNSLGAGRVSISWNPVVGADGYVFQLRIKGMDRWLVTFPSLNNQLSVGGPTHLDFEYRVKTVCRGGDSDYTDVFEFNTRNDGSLITASSRSNKEQLDINLTDLLNESTVFPNPFKDQLDVTYTPIGKKATLIIHHINGQLIHQSTIVEGQMIHSIDASNWEAGLYLLSIKEKGQAIISHKISKGIN